MRSAQIIAARTSEQYLENTLSQTVEHLRQKGAGSLSRVADILWRMSFELQPLLTSFAPPYRLEFRHSKFLSLREKAELEAYLMGL